MKYLSIVIPTRNRSNYLKFTLESAIKQDSKYYEIIVADNSTDRQSELVVNKLESSHIKYYRTGGHLSMSENWEFAVSKAEGLFVSIIGDDDAVMPFFVSRVIELHEKFEPEVIFWREHVYFWPDGKKKGRIDYFSPKSKDTIYEVKDKIKMVLQMGGSGLRSIPMIYHSAIKRTLLDKICKDSYGLFPAAQPDVYNGFMVAANNPSVILSGEALSISGWSPTSNSGSMRKKYNSAELKEYVEMSGNKLHITLLDIGEMRFFNTTPDAILKAMDCYPEYFKDLNFNYSAMWALFNRLNSYRSTLWILNNKSIISTVHNFNIIHYLFFLTLNGLYSLKIMLKKFLQIKLKRNIGTIIDCINLLTRKK
jgi:glycosyltransferase involved in cell wall biosynthesis